MDFSRNENGSNGLNGIRNQNGSNGLNGIWDQNGLDGVVWNQELAGNVEPYDLNRSYEAFVFDRFSDSVSTTIYSKVFSEIKSKIMAINEHNLESEEISELEKSKFMEKYNVIELRESINKFKKSVVEIHNKKISTEIKLSVAKTDYTDFSNKILSLLTHLNSVPDSTEDPILNDLLLKRLQGYYSMLDLDTLKSSVDSIENEYSYIKNILTSVYSLLPPTTCQICLESEITHFMDPCGHTLCRDCFEKISGIQNCHYCRCKVDKIKRLYL